MNSVTEILMKKITRDNRINVWHKSILMSLIEILLEGNGQNPFQISRKKIMEIAKIKGIPTYHKYMKDLQAFDYIEYTPSYHPMLGSKVRIK